MRQVRVSTVNSRCACNAAEDMDSVLDRTIPRIRLCARESPDIILLSEVFANYPADNTVEAYKAAAQSLDGPLVQCLAEIAKELGSYIAFGMLRLEQDKVYNSLVLLERRGKVAWIYDKTCPIISEMECGVVPGSPGYYDCDFGRVGGAICFDINFNEIAECYLRQNVELLLFSSAFPAGRLLDLWSVRYGFSIVAATWYPKNLIMDTMGRLLSQTSDILPSATAEINLNRRIVHMDGNLEKIDRVLEKYGFDVQIEDFRDEAVVVVRSMREGLEIADIMNEFQIEPLHDYLDRSRRFREHCGGLESMFTGIGGSN